MGEVHVISPDVLTDRRADAAIEAWKMWSQPEELIPGEVQLSLVSHNESPDLTLRADRPKLRLLESDTDVRKELVRKFMRSTVPKLPIFIKS